MGKINEIHELGKWHQTNDSWLNNIEEISSMSQQSATKELGKSITETCVGKIKCFYCCSGYNSVSCKKRNEAKKQSKNFKNGEGANGSRKRLAAAVADDEILESYMMWKEGRWGNPYLLLGIEEIADLIIRNSIKHLPGWMVVETEIGVVKGGKQKEAQDNDKGNGGGELYEFQTITSITKKESQIHMDQIEQMSELRI
ncbi:hypothetical protein LOAG_10101 [Loa loa]|uniref:Uncharacterized protein n=1 Tax=Loa loa TaxID=7209 RepID=A0A1S0TS35_LOALO|nr:hypothetical protein LOAG_10101 [Loa loa]EFO18394.2 hypothetical protein LOAG_10101 [Loa loa]